MRCGGIGCTGRPKHYGTIDHIVESPVPLFIEPMKGSCSRYSPFTAAVIGAVALVVAIAYIVRKPLQEPAVHPVKARPGRRLVLHCGPYIPICNMITERRARP